MHNVELKVSLIEGKFDIWKAEIEDNSTDMTAFNKKAIKSSCASGSTEDLINDIHSDIIGGQFLPGLFDLLVVYSKRNFYLLTHFPISISQIMYIMYRKIMSAQIKNYVMQYTAFLNLKEFGNFEQERQILDEMVKRRCFEITQKYEATVDEVDKTIYMKDPDSYKENVTFIAVRNSPVDSAIFSMLPVMSNFDED